MILKMFNDRRGSLLFSRPSFDLGRIIRTYNRNGAKKTTVCVCVWSGIFISIKFIELETVGMAIASLADVANYLEPSRSTPGKFVVSITAASLHVSK